MGAQHLAALALRRAERKFIAAALKHAALSAQIFTDAGPPAGSGPDRRYAERAFLEAAKRLGAARRANRKVPATVPGGAPTGAA